MAFEIAVFDAYGTLFDVEAAARRAADSAGGAGLADTWEAVAGDWRRKQLEYSWLRAVSGDYTSFWQLTQDGLDWALARAGLADPELRETLLGLYWELETYPEVPVMLETLADMGRPAAILSNGSPDMLRAACESAGISHLLADSLSADAVGTFKPARAVYDLVGNRFGTRPAEVLFVSSNGWDVAGAAAYGFITAWVNRAGAPMELLPGRPAHVLPDLSNLPELA